MGKEKTNPVTGHRHPHGLAAGQYRPTPSANSALGAAAGGIRMFEEVTAPIIEPQLAILARLHGQSALVRPNSGHTSAEETDRSLVDKDVTTVVRSAATAEICRTNTDDCVRFVAILHGGDGPHRGRRDDLNVSWLMAHVHLGPATGPSKRSHEIPHRTPGP